MRIAITGSSGWIGHSLASSLARAGVHVVPISRSGRFPGTIPIDISSADSSRLLQRAFRGCDAVVHCAGLAHQFDASGAFEEFGRVNGLGTRRVVEAAESSDVSRFILAGTIAVYDWKLPGSARRESDHLRPISPYALSKATSEIYVAGSRVDWCIARIATVYGDGDKGNILRLARMLMRSFAVVPDGCDVFKSLVHIDDVVDVLSLLALGGAPARAVLNIAPVQPVNLDDVYEALCEALAVSTPITLPKGVFSVLGKIADVVECAGRELPVNSGVIERLVASTVVDGTKVAAMFPKKTWFGFCDGLSRSSDYYRRACLVSKRPACDLRMRHCR
jgi:nucleoside-diphosphate-sugar epimerase